MMLTFPSNPRSTDHADLQWPTFETHISLFLNHDEQRFGREVKKKKKKNN